MWWLIKASLVLKVVFNWPKPLCPLLKQKPIVKLKSYTKKKSACLPVGASIFFFKKKSARPLLATIGTAVQVPSPPLVTQVVCVWEKETVRARAREGQTEGGRGGGGGIGSVCFLSTLTWSSKIGGEENLFSRQLLSLLPSRMSSPVMICSGLVCVGTSLLS